TPAPQAVEPAAPPASTPPAPTPPAAAATPPRYVPDLTTPQIPAWVVEPIAQFDELTIDKNSVIGLRLDVPVSSRTARVEDRVSATISRDVRVQGRVAIAEGARLEGTVVLVERGGKFRTAPRLGLRFDTLILTDSTRM